MTYDYILFLYEEYEINIHIVDFRGKVQNTWAIYNHNRIKIEKNQFKVASLFPWLRWPTP